MAGDSCHSKQICLKHPNQIFWKKYITSCQICNFHSVSYELTIWFACFKLKKLWNLRANIQRGDTLIQEVVYLAKRYAGLRPTKKQPMNATMTIEHRTFISSDKFSIPEWLRINWIGTVRDPIDRVASWYYFRSRTRTFRPGILDLVHEFIFR